MKKLFLTTALLGTMAAFSAAAQGYNPYYPNNVPNNFYGYNAQQNRVKRAAPEFKKFSVGFDYVLGSASLSSQDFTMASPLPGGADYAGNTDKFDDSTDSLNFNIGFRPFRYLGFEAFYQHSLSDNQVKYHESYSGDPRFALAEYNLKYSAYGLDAIIYLPVLSRLDILGALGVANYDVSGDVELSGYNGSTSNRISRNKTSFSDNKVAFRYGGGAQIWLSQRLAFRAMYRYTSISGDFIDDISEVSLGLRYNF